MTQEEFAKISMVLKAFYTNPNFLADNYSMSAWFSQLKDLDYKAVSNAVQMYVQTEKYPPTIADIRQRVLELYPQEEQLGVLEAWALVSKALRNGLYHAQEEFDKLPTNVQEAVGSADNLRNWSQTDPQSVETVISSHFRNVYTNVLQRESKKSVLSPNLIAIVEESKHIGIERKDN